MAASETDPRVANYLEWREWLTEALAPELDDVRRSIQGRLDPLFLGPSPEERPDPRLSEAGLMERGLAWRQQTTLRIEIEETGRAAEVAAAVGLGLQFAELSKAPDSSTPQAWSPRKLRAAQTSLRATLTRVREAGLEVRPIASSLIETALLLSAVRGGLFTLPPVAHAGAKLNPTTLVAVLLDYSLADMQAQPRRDLITRILRDAFGESIAPEALRSRIRDYLRRHPELRDFSSAR